MQPIVLKVFKYLDFYIINNKYLTNKYSLYVNIIILVIIRKNPFLFKQIIDLFLYQTKLIIFNIFKDLRFLVLLLLIFTYVSIKYSESAINIVNFFLHISILIFLVNITIFFIKKEDLNPIFYYIILFLLIILHILVLFLVYQDILSIYYQILNYIIKFDPFYKISSLKSYVLDKYFKSPQDPRNPNSKVFFWEKKRKQKEKIDSLKKKYEEDIELRQKNGWGNPNINSSDAALNSDKKPFSQRRNWTNTISIEEKLNLNKADLLQNAEKEYMDYVNNQKKTKKIVKDTFFHREKFYPNEARTEFRENIKLIEILKNNLLSIIENLKK